MFIVYAIESLSTKRIYIGQTGNIQDRMKYHNSGYVKSTSKERPWKLIAIESIESRDEARWIEFSLKKSRGRRSQWIEKYRLNL